MKTMILLFALAVCGVSGHAKDYELSGPVPSSGELRYFLNKEEEISNLKVENEHLKWKVQAQDERIKELREVNRKLRARVK